MQTKIVFFDVDGTLLSHELGCIPKSSVDALRSLRANGVKVFLSTGRSVQVLHDLSVMDVIEVDGVVSLNGALCLDQDGLIHGVALTDEDIQKVEYFSEHENVALQYIEKDRLYVNFVNASSKHALDAVHTKMPKLGVHEDAPVYQIIAFAEHDRLSTLKLDDARITYWHDEAVDIVHASAGKAMGMLEVLKKYGFRKEEAIAFGDGHNDMDILQAAGLGIAVGNADPALKAVADEICLPVEEDGVALKLKELGLIR